MIGGSRYRAGAAFVVFGRAEGDFAASYDLKSADVVDGQTAASFLGLRAQDALGVGVGSAGDLNGDGVADVWVRKRNTQERRSVLHAPSDYEKTHDVLTLSAACPVEF